MGSGKMLGYVRVSSIDQNEVRQVEALTAAGVEMFFMDKASGSSRKRQELERLLAYARDGDEVIVVSLDRLARNVLDLLSIVKELNSKQVKVRFLKEGMTFAGDDSPMSELMLTFLGAFAAWERAAIRERQAAGIAAAKKRGVYTGGRKRLTNEQAAELRRRAAAGESKADLGRAFGITRQTVYDYLPPLKEVAITAGP